VGRGKSDWLADPAHYGDAQYLADMNALVARSGAESVQWVGTSMGGLMGMLMAAQPGSPIARMVVNDVGPFLPKEAIARIVAYAGNDPRFPDRDALDAYLRTIYAPFGPFTAAQWQGLVDSTVRETPEGDVALAYDPDIVAPLRAAAGQDVDMWPLWDRVACPALLLRGAESDVLPRATAEEMTRRGPCPTLHEFAGIGHAPSLMSEEQVGLIVDWLG